MRNTKRAVLLKNTGFGSGAMLFMIGPRLGRHRPRGKFEIRISKSETNAKFEISMFKTP
jgi:hypothetical protein